MSADIKPGDYVTARHVNGDVLTGLVLKVESPTAMLVRTGAVIARLELAEWELERSWRAGIYQYRDLLRYRRDGEWFAPPAVRGKKDPCRSSGPVALNTSDDVYRDWTFIGPEASR